MVIVVFMSELKGGQCEIVVGQHCVYGTAKCVPMTHAPETGAMNRLHFSGAGLWYVCHANLGPDSSYYQIPVPTATLFCFKPESGVHVTEMNIFDLFLLNLTFGYNTGCDNSSHLGKFVVYIAFSHVYFQCQKYSFQVYIVRKTDTGKWESIYGAGLMGIRHASVILTFSVSDNSA